MSNSLPRYSVGEEIANSVTHGVGVVLALAGMAALAVFASVFGTLAHLVTCIIYGMTLVLLYTASTLYHGITLPRAKAFCRFLDHSAIYLFIAGTYTPFALIAVGGTLGWFLFGLVWSMALLGILLQRVSMRQKGWVTALPYLAMGWLGVLALKPLLENVAPGGVLLLFAGGIAYSLGVVFFVWKRLPYHHAIWHLFVLAGSAFHFFAVLLFVIPVVG